MQHIAETLAKAMQMHSDGCAMNAGMTATQFQSKPRLQESELPSQASQIEPGKPFSEASKLKDDNVSKAQLGEFLLQCYDALTTYGKTPEQLENYTKIFLLALGDYSYEQIKEAFLKHIQQSANLPMPADIIKIINPPKPELSKSMYVQIMKECTTGGRFLYGERRDFVEAYEAQEMAKMRGGSQDLRDAKREIENQQFDQLEYSA